MGNAVSTSTNSFSEYCKSTLGRQTNGNSRTSTGVKSDKKTRKSCTLPNSTNNCKQDRRHNQQQQQENPEQHQTSRILFLLYLLHKTWNVVVDTVDNRGKRSRSSNSSSEDSGAPRSHFDDIDYDTDYFNLTDLEDHDINNSSLYGSQYSFCSCSYCHESRTSIVGVNQVRTPHRNHSMCNSDITYCWGFPMAPSAGKSPPGAHGLTNIQLTEMSTHNGGDASANGWQQPNCFVKENQRPPVYNPEDYVVSLKKYGRRPNGSKSIYDTTIESLVNTKNVQSDGRSSTLPASKHGSHNSGSNNNEYRSPIPSPPEQDAEMTLRQFGSITDLLTKLRSDLRAAFPSFVQEFVANPMDGVSLLLEVLRAIQLSQSMPNGTTSMPASPIQRNSQSYQRRALLDELACLQCLSICCSRSPEAGARLGTSPIGLLPLAASATGQGIRSRIIALQLLATACDKTAFGNGTQRTAASGHTAVSEALSTLRLRCGEPVRFRLLVGMLSSGGGTGELQAVGMRFLNTFVESAENSQNRLYLQAELFQAGLEPSSMTKTISSTSPWLEKLRYEVKHWDEIKIDIDRLQLQARESEKLKSQMVILDRRVQILQEEKGVLTSMERRLQERCAELQREIFRLQGTQTDKSITNSLEKPPVALPRQVPPQGKRDSSEQEDEGISSSETGQSLSPEPPHCLPKQENGREHCNKDEDPTIDDVIEELENIVNDAQREISLKKDFIVIRPLSATVSLSGENEIVPVNLLPQPPRKSRSLVHLLASSSELDGSDYGLLMPTNEMSNCNRTKSNSMLQNNSNGVGPTECPNGIVNPGYYDEEPRDCVTVNGKCGLGCDSSANRDLLNVIMDAREKEDNLIYTFCNAAHTTERVAPPPQQYNGVFFMSDMAGQNKYPKPDTGNIGLTAKRVTKNLDRMESYGLDSMIDIVMTSSNAAEHKQKLNAANAQTHHLYLPSRHTASTALASSSAFKIRTGHTNAGLYSGTLVKRDVITPRTQSYQGSKVTDLPSGLY